MIEAAGIYQRFGDREILRDVNLKVEQGEILAIMGSSGGGKTTLLRILSGLLIPTQGTVTIDGIEVVKQPDLAREKVGLVFQSGALFDFMSIEENVAFGLERRPGISRSTARTRAREVLKDVGLEHAGALSPSEISGGMKKRAALARVLVMEPQAILYDEPTSGLDPITAYTVDSLIVETRDRTGAASILVSHDVNSVVRVSDRILFLDKGAPAFYGSPAEFLQSNQPSLAELREKAQALQLMP